MNNFVALESKKKTAKNKWEIYDSEFLQDLDSIYKKIMTVLFPYLLVNLFKQRYIKFVKSYEYLSKFIDIKTAVLPFLKYHLYEHNPLNKVIKS